VSLAHAKPKHILLAGRSEDKIKPVIEEINRISPSTKVTLIPIDLGSQASVRGAAAAINNATEEIDILINNAAIMACPYAKTEDGIESQFATNYIGHFLLTNLLMGKLQAAGEGARVVNLTSTASASGEINLDDVNFDVSLRSQSIPGSKILTRFS
jgi:NAD(P)-dependent dehydrogenase (short-subunit alcohol dehydrogenase family)